MDTRSFIIPAAKKSLVEAQIIKLNKRAAKMGLDTITLSWGKAYVDDADVLWQDPRYADSHPEMITKKVLLIPVEITGPLSVKYDGWNFIAALQHLPTNENIIRKISELVEIPVQYRNADPNCDHCRTHRYRKDTYLVQHDDGRIYQVGSTCVKDFVGNNCPDDILNKAAFIAELLSFMDGCEHDGSGSGEPVYHIKQFLALTSAVIRDHGWMSKTNANITGETPTANWVELNLNPTPSLKPSEVNEQDNALADKVVEWVENLSDKDCESDYLYNLRVIARSGMVGRRTFGFTTSMISAYKKTIEVSSKDYIGKVKDKVDLVLTLKNQFSFSSMYGVVNKLIFQDPNGNSIVWATSTKQDVELGKTYVVKGTIKKHTEYKGMKQTELTRCAIFSI